MTGSLGPDELRIGSREREASIRLLGTHMAAGRLNSGEYEERVMAALAARTRRDLRTLFADLPPPSAPAAARAADRIAGDLRVELAGEGLLVFEEGLRGSITFHDFRAAGSYSSWRRVWVTGSVAVTWRRIVVWARRGKQVDLPFAHPLRAAVSIGLEKSNVLRIESDAGAFHPQRSGRIVYRLRTGSAETIRDLCG